MARAFRNWTAWRARELPREFIPVSRRIRSATALGLGPTSRLTRIKPAQERFAKEWFWRLSRGFTGQGAAACGRYPNADARVRGIQTPPTTRRIFRRRVTPPTH